MNARVNWGMLRNLEFWLFLLGSIFGLIALSKRLPADSLLHDLAVGASSLIAMVSAWLTQKAREAPSPVQEAVIDSKNSLIESQGKIIEHNEKVIGNLADCVQRNHPDAPKRDTPTQLPKVP